MAGVSDSLLWLLVKDNNSFLYKRGRTSRLGAVQFSAEPGNVLNANSFKYSGLANSKSVDVGSKDKDITLTLKATSKKTNPKGSKVVIPLKKNAKTSLRVVSSQGASSFYRADLKSAAAARYKSLYTDVRVKKGVIKGARSKAGRNSR